MLHYHFAANIQESHRFLKFSDLQVLVLENVRFYKEETKNDPGFAEKVPHHALYMAAKHSGNSCGSSFLLSSGIWGLILALGCCNKGSLASSCLTDSVFALLQLAANADIFVNDAFGTAHRAHASTEGVTKFLSPSVAGLLLQKELDYLDGAVKEPKRPFVAIVGGSKVSSKIGVIESLLEKTDKIILGCVLLQIHAKSASRLSYRTIPKSQFPVCLALQTMLHQIHHNPATARILQQEQGNAKV